MCGCEQSIDAQQVKRVDAPLATAADTRAESLETPGVENKNGREPEARAKLQELRTQIFTLQSQYDALRIERDRIAGQVESHQAEGEKKLAALKAQWSALDRKSASDPSEIAARERFAESARVEMESALMMDDEYRAQLRDTDEKLRQMQQQLSELRTHEAKLETHD